MEIEVLKFVWNYLYNDWKWNQAESDVYVVAVSIPSLFSDLRTMNVSS